MTAILLVAALACSDSATVLPQNLKPLVGRGNEYKVLRDKLPKTREDAQQLKELDAAHLFSDILGIEVYRKWSRPFKGLCDYDYRYKSLITCSFKERWSFNIEIADEAAPLGPIGQTNLDGSVLYKYLDSNVIDYTLVDMAVLDRYVRFDTKDISWVAVWNSDFKHSRAIRFHSEGGFIKFVEEKQCAKYIQKSAIDGNLKDSWDDGGYTEHDTRVSDVTLEIPEVDVATFNSIYWTLERLLNLQNPKIEFRTLIR